MLRTSFDKIDVFMEDKTSTKPPFVDDSTNGMDAKDILFGLPNQAQTPAQVAFDFVFEKWHDSFDNEEDALDLDENVSNDEREGL